MKQGIEQLKEILVSGGRSDVPMQPPSQPRRQTMPPIPSDVAMTPEEPEMAAGSGGDSAALAQAVVQRTQGDVQQAISMLDDAKAMLMASGRKPIMAAEGTELDADGVRNMIMKGQEGRSVSDVDIRKKFMMGAPRQPSKEDLEFAKEQIKKAPSLSDKDRQLFMDRVRNYKMS
tara:strand:- start:1023 stop:1544 length:522 start_codon:yes stop_codon:yes gene_type:complete